MVSEQFINSALLMDRGDPIGNSDDAFGRRAAHVKVGNTNLEPIPVALTAAVNSNGSIDNQSITTTAHTFNPPANAIGFVLLSESSNLDNIRWAIGSVATSSVGIFYEPGRDTGFIPCAAGISVIAMSGTQKVGVQWILSS